YAQRYCRAQHNRKFKRSGQEGVAGSETPRPALASESKSKSQMSSSQASSTVERKKILRARVKVWGRLTLRPEEVFNVDKAEQVIHRALDGKHNVQTSVKLYNEGLRIGDKGVLATLAAEFIPYISVSAFISLRETPTLLALCNKLGNKSNVTVLQFKDVAALEAVCNVIDRQRHLMAKGSGAATPSHPASSLSRSEAPVQQQRQQPKLQQPPPAVIVTEVKDEALEESTATEASPSTSAKITATTTTSKSVTQPEDVSVVVASSSGSSGDGGRVELFEKRPFATDITQPPSSAAVTAVVHSPLAPSNSETKIVTVEDEEDFRTSIVFGEEVRSLEGPANETVVTESSERQQRMEALLQQRSNGHAVSETTSKRSSNGPIETVILNYDEVDTEGTHAVFDTPDGPPIQLNESADNVRLRRPQSLLVTASSSSNSGSAKQTSASRCVVTSFSSGRSDSPSDGQSVHLRSSPNADRSFRTSTVIYRDSLDSPNERPRVTYMSGGQQQRVVYAGAPSPQQQQQQLVRLVPVGSARRKVVQTRHQPQLYTIQPVAASGRENGVYPNAK
uniref:Zinc finger protein n=1 Tax=Macrostomum lignano TaxID=282301 RepID=A0A1I8GVJ7_9PLAT